MTTSIDALATDIAREVWHCTDDLYYESLSDLRDDICGLIFRVQAEALAADGSVLIQWDHDLTISPIATLVCEVEQIADGPQTFILWYSDIYEDWLPVKEWQDEGSAAALQRFRD